MARKDEKQMKIALIGSGKYSFAIASLLLQKANKLTMWTHDKTFTLPESYQKKIDLETDLTKVIQENNIIFLLISSFYVETTLKDLPQSLFKNKLLIIGTKGLLPYKPYYLSKYLRKQKHIRNLMYFAGPNLASDLEHLFPTSMTFAITKKRQINQIKNLFPDFISAHFTYLFEPIELASTLKNIYAIGSGILEAKYHSQSTTFAYLSKAYDECLSILDQIANYTKYMCDFKYIPLDITGDFFLTGTMSESRNKKYGTLMYNKEAKAKYEQENTIEGLINLPNAYKLLKKRKVKAPLFYTLYQIIFQEKDPNTLEEVTFH